MWYCMKNILWSQTIIINISLTLGRAGISAWEWNWCKGETQWLEQCWCSALLALAGRQHPWSYGLCGFLNCNPKHNPNPRQSRKSLMGVRLVPRRKMWKAQYWGSDVLALVGLLQLQCPWSTFYSYWRNNIIWDYMNATIQFLVGHTSRSSPSIFW